MYLPITAVNSCGGKSKGERAVYIATKENVRPSEYVYVCTFSTRNICCSFHVGSHSTDLKFTRGYRARDRKPLLTMLYDDFNEFRFDRNIFVISKRYYFFFFEYIAIESPSNSITTNDRPDTAKVQQFLPVHAGHELISQRIVEVDKMLCRDFRCAPDPNTLTTIFKTSFHDPRTWF